MGDQLLKLKEQREALKQQGQKHEDTIMKENAKLQKEVKYRITYMKEYMEKIEKGLAEDAKAAAEFKDLQREKERKEVERERLWREQERAREELERAEMVKKEKGRKSSRRRYGTEAAATVVRKVRGRKRKRRKRARTETEALKARPVLIARERRRGRRQERLWREQE